MKKEALRRAAEELAAEIGTINLKRPDVCARAGIPEGSFVSIMGQSFTEFVTTLEAPLGVKSKASRSVSAKLSKQGIIAAAVVEAERDGYRRFTRSAVAERAGVSESLIQYHFGTMTALRLAVMDYAVTEEVLPIIAQGLAVKDPIAGKAPSQVRKAAVKLLSQ